MTIKESKLNILYEIIKLSDENLKIRKRLLDLGFTIGAKLIVTDIAPLNSTFVINIHGSNIALRDNAAMMVHIKEVKNNKLD